MEVKFERKFLKQIDKIQDKRLAEEIKQIIAGVKTAGSLKDISELKKLSGYKNAYLIRMRDYRIGLVVGKTTVEFVCFMHRKEIYRYFP